MFPTDRLKKLGGVPQKKTTTTRTFRPIIPTESDNNSGPKDSSVEKLLRATNLKERPLFRAKPPDSRPAANLKKTEQKVTVVGLTAAATGESSQRKKARQQKQAEAEPETKAFGREYYKDEVIDPGNILHPLVVPFPSIEKLESMSSDRARELVYYQDADFLEEGQCALFQFPTDLPFQNEAKETQTEDQKKRGAVSSGFLNVNSVLNPNQKHQNKFQQIKSGEIGKIKRYKSGKVELEMGGFVFIVSDNGGTSFLQQFASLDLENKSCTHMGEISKRFTVHPDFSALLGNKDSTNTQNKNL